MRIPGRAFWGQGTARAKAKRQEHAWCVREIVRAPVWLEQSEQEEEEEDRGQKEAPKGP